MIKFLDTDKALGVLAKRFWGSVLLTIVCFVSNVVSAQKQADQVFAELHNSVFQIRIKEINSGSQAALGTGFYIGDGRIATNYHVVSSDILDAERYQIEVDIAGQSYPLQVEIVDVVNDLALLVGQQLPELGAAFRLALVPPNQGATLYALGNPHNLGLTIVQGNYNGLVEHKFLDRIHYSGAINAGMSGGPAVDSEYNVVGINVASAGNQVGFLVPVKALRNLVSRAASLGDQFDILDDMAKQIASTTDAMLEQFLAAQWPMETMGKVRILGKPVSWFDCWGDSEEDKQSRRLEISRGCNNGDDIFLSHNFNTAFFEYEYRYFYIPEWPEAAFYRYLRSASGGAVPANNVTKDDVENYVCENAHVVTDAADKSMRRRVSYCLRAYKQLKGLYDVFYIGVTEDKGNSAVLDHFTLSGVTRASSQAFLEKFIGVLAWE